MSEDTAAADGAAFEEESPRFFDTYALVYAFTLLALVPSGFALARLPMYSYSPLYTTLVALPPLLGMLMVVVTDERRGSALSVLGRTALLTAISLTGSLALIFGGALLLVPISRWLVPANFGAFAAVSAVLLAVFAAPMVPALVRVVRASGGRGGGRWIRVAVLAFALVAVGVALWLTFAPGRLLVTALRRDQVSFLMGALTWYLPAYGASAALARAVGLG